MFLFAGASRWLVLASYIVWICCIPSVLLLAHVALCCLRDAIQIFLALLVAVAPEKFVQLARIVSGCEL